MQVAGDRQAIPQRPYLAWTHRVEVASLTTPLPDQAYYGVTIQSAPFNSVAFQSPLVFWFEATDICTGITCVVSLADLSQAIVYPQPEGEVAARTLFDLVGLFDGAYTWHVSYFVPGMETVLDSFQSFFIVDLEAPSLVNNIAVDTSQSPLVFSWTDDPNALYFQVAIVATDPLSGFVPFVSWFGKSDGNLTCDGVNCQVAIDDGFNVGDYDFYVQAWGPGGFSSGGIEGWAQMNFTVDTPQQSSLAFSTQMSGQVTLSWGSNQGAVAYEVWVGTRQPNNAIVHEIYTSQDVACDLSVLCELPLDTYLVNGEYHWYVRPYLANGSPLRWSNGPIISVQHAPPEAVDTMTVQQSALNGETHLEWQPMANARWYRLYIQATETMGAFDQWYDATDICDSSICRVSFPLPPGSYLWYLQPMGPGGEGDWSLPFTFSID